MRKRVNKSTKSVTKAPVVITPVTTPTVAINTSGSETAANASELIAPMDKAVIAINQSTLLVKKTRMPINKVALPSLVSAAKKEKEIVFKKTPEKAVVRMMGAVFTSLATQLRESAEGSVKLMGVGKFIIKPVQRTIKGEETTKLRVIFRAVEPKKKVEIAEETVVASTKTAEVTNSVVENASTATETVEIATESVSPSPKAVPETSHTVTQTTGNINKMTEITNKPKKAVKIVKLADLINTAKSENAAAFGKINEKRAAAIVRAVLAQASQEIKNTEEGSIALLGLGRFTVKQIQVGKEGQKVVKRRVTFQAAAAKQKKAE